MTPEQARAWLDAYNPADADPTVAKAAYDLSIAQMRLNDPEAYKAHMILQNRDIFAKTNPDAVSWA